METPTIKCAFKNPPFNSPVKYLHDGRGLFREDLEAERDPVAVVGGDLLGGESGAAEVEDGRQHEHRLRGESVPLLLVIANRSVVPENEGEDVKLVDMETTI